MLPSYDDCSALYVRGLFISLFFVRIQAVKVNLWITLLNYSKGRPSCFKIINFL